MNEYGDDSFTAAVLSLFLGPARQSLDDGIYGFQVTGVWCQRNRNVFSVVVYMVSLISQMVLDVVRTAILVGRFHGLEFREYFNCRFVKDVSENIEAPPV